MNVSRVLRQDVAPVGSAYLVLLVVLVWYAKSRRRGGPTGPGRPSVAGAARDLTGPSLVRSLAASLAAGYVVFALIIAVFYLVLGGQPKDFIPESLLQGSVLAFGVVLPAFVLLTLAESAWRRRRP
jgi:Family of unknown function (DUF6256)